MPVSGIVLNVAVVLQFEIFRMKFNNYFFEKFAIAVKIFKNLFQVVKHSDKSNLRKIPFFSFETSKITLFSTQSLLFF